MLVVGDRAHARQRRLRSVVPAESTTSAWSVSRAGIISCGRPAILGLRLADHHAWRRRARPRWCRPPAVGLAVGQPDLHGPGMTDLSRSFWPDPSLQAALALNRRRYFGGSRHAALPALGLTEISLPGERGFRPAGQLLSGNDRNFGRNLPAPVRPNDPACGKESATASRTALSP